MIKYIQMYYLLLLFALVAIKLSFQDSEDIDYNKLIDLTKTKNNIDEKINESLINKSFNDEFDRKNYYLIKNLFKLSKKYLNELNDKNEGLVKKYNYCNISLSWLISKHEQQQQQQSNNNLFQDKNQNKHIVSEIYQDLRNYFTELEQNNQIITNLKSQINELKSQNENCYTNLTSVSINRIYKRANDCSVVNLTGIVLIEYEDINIDVYCENGWLLIQRRQYGHNTNFNRSWNDYKNGFGSLRGEFWLGNDIIHKMTNSKKYKLRIELVDWSDNYYVADYEQFKIDNEHNDYRLYLSNSYSGNTSRNIIDDQHYGLSAHNNSYFQTYDHTDHKKHNCAHKTGGAWWFINQTVCLPVNLNGILITGASSPSTKGIKWLAMNNHDKNYSLKKSKMKIKPN